jgi:hypothetical protein
MPGQEKAVIQLSPATACFRSSFVRRHMGMLAQPMAPAPAPAPLAASDGNGAGSSPPSANTCFAWRRNQSRSRRAATGLSSRSKPSDTGLIPVPSSPGLDGCGQRCSDYLRRGPTDPSSHKRVKLPPGPRPLLTPGRSRPSWKRCLTPSWALGSPLALHCSSLARNKVGVTFDHR